MLLLLVAEDVDICSPGFLPSPNQGEPLSVSDFERRSLQGVRLNKKDFWLGAAQRHFAVLLLNSV